MFRTKKCKKRKRKNAFKLLKRKTKGKGKEEEKNLGTFLSNRNVPSNFVEINWRTKSPPGFFSSE